MRRVLRWCIPALLLTAAAAGGVVQSLGAVPTFDGQVAQRWIERQCALGPRVPGTAASRAWLKLAQAYFDSLGLAQRLEPFRHPSPLGADTLRLNNLVVSIRPDARPRLLLGAHWDSRPWADEDPDSAAWTQPVLGANDGGSGVAVLFTLAAILQKNPPPIGVDLALFDAEDLGHAGKPEDFCLGSKWMAAHWSGPRPDWVIVLDMVGSASLEIGRELYSAQYAPELQNLIFRIAHEKGYGEWNPQVEYGVVDDHLAFAELGIPAVDLIGFGDPVWHTTQDVPSRTSARSLGRVGGVITVLIYGGVLAP